MRRLVILLLAVLACTAAFAQEATTFSLAKCQTVIKVTNPEQQLKVFEPLLSRVDELAGMVNKGQTPPSQTVATFIKQMTTLPGVDAPGDFWFVYIRPKTVETDPAKAMKAMIPSIAILPLQDAAPFRAALATGPLKAAMPPCQVFDNCALVNLSGATLPQYTKVDFDLKLVSTRDIVMTGQMAGFQMPEIPTNATGGAETAMMGGMLTSMAGLIDELKDNVERNEVSLTMVGDDLSLEMYETPLPDSPLAKSLAKPDASALPLQLAGYLPENLAYCGASGPRLPGAPGAGYVTLRMLTSIAGGFLLPPARQQAFARQLEALAAQCSQGRAIGITAPPANTPGNVTMVGVYHITNPQDATTAVNNFVQEVIRSRDAMMNGALTNAIKIFPRSNYAKAGDVSVDLIKILIPGAEGDATDPFTIECYLACMSDKMLFTAGPGSKEEMQALIGRIKSGKTGFTSSKRFATLKAGLPDNIRGFESYATLDLCRAGINLVPLSLQEKNDALKWMSIFPAHRTVISTHSEAIDGRLHSEFIVPGEQLDFFSSLAKAAFLTNATHQAVGQENAAD